MRMVKGGITAPRGFKANGIHCGIKKNKKLDLGLIYSEVVANACGMFTTNKIQAAPLKITQEHLKSNLARAIIVNSGNANCLTGKTGLINGLHILHKLSEVLGIDKKLILNASTGIIGRQLPINRIEANLDNLVNGLSRNGLDNAAISIMTTDRKPKERAVRFKINNQNVTIAAIAKGAGMIYPNLATLLVFITTDLAIKGNILKQALRQAVNKTFNCISIDGCTSTNDMILILANGLARNRIIDKKDKNFIQFTKALEYVCQDLSRKIVQDAEGATKFVEINVSGAKTIADAKKVAFNIANSSLVKTAIFGGGKNWGRIAQAVGASGVDIQENNLKIGFSSFKNKKVRINVDLNMGKNEITVFTTDLSEEYVRINARYN